MSVLIPKVIHDFFRASDILQPSGPFYRPWYILLGLEYLEGSQS